jgi:hypothetical protein
MENQEVKMQEFIEQVEASGELENLLIVVLLKQLIKKWPADKKAKTLAQIKNLKDAITIIEATQPGKDFKQAEEIVNTLLLVLS